MGVQKGILFEWCRLYFTGASTSPIPSWACPINSTSAVFPKAFSALVSSHCPRSGFYNFSVGLLLSSLRCDRSKLKLSKVHDLSIRINILFSNFVKYAIQNF